MDIEKNTKVADTSKNGVSTDSSSSGLKLKKVVERSRKGVKAQCIAHNIEMNIPKLSMFWQQSLLSP